MGLESIVIAEFRQAAAASSALLADPHVATELAGLAQGCVDVLRVGGKVVFAGNGGSFAQALHLAAELVGRFRRERAPLASLALGGNGASLTAISNDYSYEDALLREAAVMLHPTDQLVVLSTSGNSPNVVALAKRHVAAGGKCVAWTGQDGGAISAECPVLKAPAQDTARVQEIHLLLGHTLCHLIETELSND